MQRNRHQHVAGGDEGRTGRYHEPREGGGDIGAVVMLEGQNERTAVVAVAERGARLAKQRALLQARTAQHGFAFRI